jgi:polar amino acid transport system substrate-binding protein
VWLQEHLTAAPAPTADYKLRVAAQRLLDGTVDAFAGGRQRLASGTQSVRGLRLLDDNFYGVPQTIAVQLDRADRLQRVNAALDELRANGFLADSVVRSGIDGLTVAPAERPSR